jgi:DNA-binding NtrC family response regulator
MSYAIPLVNTVKEALRPRPAVLIVEDDPTFRPILTRILKSIDPDVQVDWVRSVGAAHRKLQERRYRLVLADYFLEGISSGMELWKYCQSKLPETPFILMSGLHEKTVTHLAQHEGVLSPPYLRKPFASSAVRYAVLDVAGKL